MPDNTVPPDTAPLTSEGSGAPEKSGARVSIIMGSDSDWPTMQPAAEVLDEFGVPYEADVVSAHRMPEEMVRFGRAAHTRGIEVIERRSMPDELSGFTECFITGTAAEVTAVSEIAQWKFTPAAITKQLMDDYTAEVQPKAHAA